ncbi:MAG: NAD-dependent epimerase/dehydratase family protein [Calditrichaeota bacterium]|nr:MAG: NAD-dependent epimerase/dehydratase family protein [Calditrichota bacterium]
MNVLILGGTNFVGPQIAKQLHNRGHKVSLFHRGVTEAHHIIPEEVHHIRCGKDGKLEDFLEEIKIFSPDAVIHMTPIGEKDSKRIVNFFKGITERIISISSMDVYQVYGVIHETENVPINNEIITESSPLRTNLYPYRKDFPDKNHVLHNYDKILAEREILGDSEISGTILRLPVIYGERDFQHRFYSTLKRFEDKRPAILLEETFAKFIISRAFVEDVAFAIVLATEQEKAKNQVYNVANEYFLTEKEMNKKLAEVFGWKGKIVVIPDADSEKAKSMRQHIISSSEKIRTELGYKELYPFEEGLKKTVEFQMENPPKKIDHKMFDYKKEDEILSKLIT